MERLKSLFNFIKEKKLIVIMLLICAVGSIFQIVHVSQLYFSYETVVNIQLERSSYIELPSMTICTSIYYTINYTLLFEKFPNMKSELESAMKKNITDY